MTKFSDLENERLREVAYELSEELGLDTLAAELGTLQSAVRNFIAGKTTAKAQMANNIARLKGVPLEELLATPPADPPPPPQRPAVKSIAAASTERAPPSVVAPTIIEPARIDVAPEPPLLESALPPPAAPTVRRDVDARAPTLAMLEWADVSMGLEVVPHRRDEVFAKYGLLTAAAQDAEADAWDRYFEANPRDRRDWQAMRERMRQSWVNFDRRAQPGVEATPHTIAAVADPAPAPPTLIAWPAIEPMAHTAAPQSVRSTLSTGAALPPPTAIDPNAGNETAAFVGIGVFEDAPAPAPPPPPTVPAPAPPPTTVPAATTPAMPLHTYALLAVEIRAAMSHAHAEAIFARYGLADPIQRAAVDAAWQARLATNPEERIEFERKCAECRAILAPPPATTVARVAPTPAPVTALPPRPMPIGAYASMCLELEMKPMNKEAIYARHGLVTPAKRKAVHDAWAARLATLPEERAEYDALMKRFRDDWMDLDF